jgi:hypothetical protein
VPNQIAGFASGTSFPTGITVQTFEVNDGHGNLSTCSFTVKVTSAMQVALEAEQVSCFGQMDGSLTASTTGGGQGYSYLWSTGATTPGISGLGVGNFSVSVTDADGCEAVQTATISEPTLLSSSPVSISPETTGQQNGAIEVEVQGGTPPYNFDWTDASGNVIVAEENLSSLAAGNYTLKLTDANGCVSIHVFTVQSVSSAKQRQLERAISLYPNPTTGFVTIDFGELETQEASISIFDFTGKLVGNFAAASIASGQFRLDATNYADGVYLVRIMVDNLVVAKRMMVHE